MFRKTSTVFLYLLFSIFMAKAQAPKSMNAAEIQLALKKLNTLGSVLYIAAHPDDENTRLLAWLANEKLMRTGYLSVTRGDGGQNLIGTEQGELLGMIRTQELLAARRIDGAEQFFTRANDFGYSKNPEETMRIWGKDSILSDMVWVIRNFRPDVILTRFPIDGRGGHGHHTASALLAIEAFSAAADPNRFPEQLKYVSIWQAKRILWNHYGRRWNPNEDVSQTLQVEVGQYNALLGKSYGEIAAESRSMHKSQGFGSASTRGQQTEYFQHFKGDSAQKDLFEGINTTWSRIGKEGKSIEKLLNKAYAQFNPEKPEAIIPILLEARNIIESYDRGNKSYNNFHNQYPLSYSDKNLFNKVNKISELNAHYLFLKYKEIDELILQCAGIHIDVLAQSEFVSLNDSVKVILTKLNRSNYQFIQFIYGIKKARIAQNMSLDYNKIVNDTLYLNFAESDNSDNISNPYWLKNKVNEGLFNVYDLNYIGLAETNLHIATLYFEVQRNKKVYGQGIRVIRSIQYKWVDPVEGEKYRPLEVVPPVTLNLSEKAYLFPNNQSQTVKLQLISYTDNASGNVKLQLPDGWRSEPATIPFDLKKKNDETWLSFTVHPPKDAQFNVNQELLIKAYAEINGESYSKSIVRINYNHIPIQTWLYDAEAKLIPIDLKTAGKNIAYIPGAGDEIPQSLQRIGYKITTLTDEMLLNEPLQKFDAIIIGIRAYNTNNRMPFYHDKLMEYIKLGGVVVAQYNTSNFVSSVSGQIGPYPFKISRDRVTVEEAPVKFLAPEHPVLNSPNKITEKDFEGWIQERGIYFAQDWDKYYIPIFEMNDPGEEPKQGSTIIAQYGKGYFVYTGLSFFRELPNGVPGAYRLFVNMISLGE